MLTVDPALGAGEWIHVDYSASNMLDLTRPLDTPIPLDGYIRGNPEGPSLQPVKWPKL